MTTVPHLLAVLRFENVTPGWLWLWAVGLLAGAGLLTATYWGIFQRSERRLTWVLMLLRGAGLLALVVALARPVWTHESETVDPGRVAVVVDNSLSMSLPDAAGRTRYAGAKEAVERLRQTLEVNRDGPRMAMDLFDINGNILEKGLPPQPTVERTDLARAVTQTAARLRSRPLAGLVVISDGMDNTGRQSFRDLPGLNVPVHCLGFAPPEAGPFDLAVRQVQAPERALVNNEIKIEVRISKTGAAAADATVQIKRGRDIFATQKSAFGPGAGEKTVTLALTSTQPGTFVFTAAVTAEGEQNLGNNAAHFPLRVDKEPIRVLYLEGFLRYEYKYLKSRLEEDPDVRLTAVVRPVNPERADTRPGTEFLTADGLKNFDVVLLGDMEGAYLTGPEYQALIRWLDDKGHALLVLGGYRSFGADGFRNTPLAEVLPVVLADKEPYQSEEAFRLHLTEEGKRHPLFELTGDRAKDAQTWAEAPQLLGASLVQRAKPGAVVLAVNPQVVNDAQPDVVIAVQRYGAGQVMVLAADTTWRWSRLTRVLGNADTLYARFWSQTVRWLAGRSLDDQRPLLAVSTDRPDYGVGKPVVVRVVRQPRPGVDLSTADMAAEVVGPGGNAVPLAVRAGSAEPDVFTGTFYPGVGGRFEVAANLTQAGKPLANQTAEFLVQGPDLELADAGTNPANLKAIADATGGLYREVDRAAELAAKVPRQERRTTSEETRALWNSPMLFAFFIIAVTAEWVIRRRNHLV